MITADVTLWLHSPLGVPLACLVPEWSSQDGYRFSSVRYRRAQNEVTELELRLPLDHAPPRELFQLDSRIEVWIDGRLDTETQWFVRVPPALEWGQDGRIYVVVRAVCALYLLEGRVIAYPNDSQQTNKTGPADDLIKEYVGENLWNGAIADRNLAAYLTLDAPLAQCPVVPKIAPRRNLMMVCQELARNSAQHGVALFFDIVWDGTRFVFRTYTVARGQDRTGGAAQLVLSPEFGTLENASLVTDHRYEFTVIYTNDGSNLVAVSDDARRNASPFNRREQYVSSPSGSSGAEADGALYRGRPRETLRGKLSSTEFVQYGRDWSWGDLVIGVLGDYVAPFSVHAVTVVIANGTVDVDGELRNGSLEDDDALRRIEQALDSANTGGSGSTGGSTTSGGTATPTADSIVRSPVGSSTIDDGWLSSTIARTSQLPAFSIAPVAHGRPQADAMGLLASGWLPSTIARTADLTWGKIDNKPLTFPPAAHEASLVTSGVFPVARGGTGVSAIPAFSVHRNGVNQGNITPTTFHKVLHTTKEYDTSNTFDTTLSRYTPNIAGYYLFILGVRFENGISGAEALVSLFRSGNEYRRMSVTYSTIVTYVALPVIAYANGTTDYFEMFVYQSSTSTFAIQGLASLTYWSGFRLIA